MLWTRRARHAGSVWTRIPQTSGSAPGDLADALHNQGVVPYLESSRRGGHLWLFLDPLPGVEARRFGHRLQTEHNLTDVELYPKQDELKTGPGSLVRLPFGVHRKTGKRYGFVGLDGQPLAPTLREQIALLAEPQHVPGEFIAAMLSHSAEPTVDSVSVTDTCTERDGWRPPAFRSPKTGHQRVRLRRPVRGFGRTRAGPLPLPR